MASIFDEGIRCRIFALSGDSDKDEKIINTFLEDLLKGTEIIKIIIAEKKVYIFYKN